ncbi:hypothetical protein LY39_03561 [Roseinatronobacter bogoriensis subsp. barguzinensis]|nr:hypothetical protein LY39_03561 [Rhodobaca barguzinensis]TDY66199.1 hypothetical protein EV660_11352 [Rhodobaca bogoriensis DSM 18756]
MFEELVKAGYDGSYERVAAFVRQWKGERQRAQNTTDRGTFVPLVFAPGEAFQFDWSEDWAYVGGERIKLQVAHIKLSHSRAFLVRAYLLQTHEMLFDAHWHAFVRGILEPVADFPLTFEGIPSRGIYDSEAWPPLMRWMAPASGIAMCHIGCCEHHQQREPSTSSMAPQWLVPGDRKRQLSLQGQLRNSEKEEEGNTSIDPNMTRRT